MQQTEQYQLNQWELADRVRMEDFNADNAKLETALTGLQTSLSGLGTRLNSLSGSVTELGVDLAGKCGRLQQFKNDALTSSEGKTYVATSLGVVDWNKWDCVVWVVDTHETTFQSGEKLSFKLNPSSGSLSEYEVTLDTGSVVFVLFPMSDKTSTVKGFVLGGSAKPLVIPVSYETIIGFILQVPYNSATKFHNVTLTAYGLK